MLHGGEPKDRPSRKIFLDRADHPVGYGPGPIGNRMLLLLLLLLLSMSQGLLVLEDSGRQFNS